MAVLANFANAIPCILGLPNDLRECILADSVSAGTWQQKELHQCCSVLKLDRGTM